MKMMLEIDLNNEAMQTFGDVKRAIADSFRNTYPEVSTDVVYISENIFDSNGNKVGKWEIVPDRFGE
jgi:hypothetical protein